MWHTVCDIQYVKKTVIILHSRNLQCSVEGVFWSCLCSLLDIKLFNLGLKLHFKPLFQAFAGLWHHQRRWWSGSAKAWNKVFKIHLRPHLNNDLFFNMSRLLLVDNVKGLLKLPVNFLEFQKIALATAIGFAIMGFIGFFVKLIHIPINNIIVQ